MDKLGVVIVGPGWVSEEHIKGYTQDKRAEIRCIVGMIPRDRETSQKYIEKYKLTNCQYTEDLPATLARKDIQVASITTINFLHGQQALAAINAGKHVLCEKPLCFNMKELKALLAAVQKHKVTTQVGHVLRFYPAIVGLKNFVDQGHIGKVFYAESDYWHEIIGEWKVKTKTGGSSLLMGGCHALDMVRWMIGEEIDAKEVMAMSVPAAWRKDFEYDPTISLLVKFKNGTVGRVGSSLECVMPYVLHLQVNGTEGTIRNNGIYSDLFPNAKGFMSIPATYPDDWNVSHHPFPEEVSYFLDCVIGKKESHLSIPRAAKTYEIIFAAEESARTGKTVKLPLK